MVLNAIYRRSLSAMHRAGWAIVAVVICLVGAAKPVSAEIIIPDRDITIDSPLAQVSDPYVVDLGAGGCCESNSERPAAPVPPSESLDTKAFPPGSMGSSTQDSSSSISHVAMPMNHIDVPELLLASQTRSRQFLFVPEAPRSGLLRPPKCLAIFA